MYNKDIKDTNQPLAISKNRRTGMEVALIPELCEMTGLTDSMRANFNLMKEVNTVLHKGGDARINEVKNLIAEIMEMPNARKLMDEWKIKFDTEPIQAEGVRLNAGNVIMGRNF